MTPLPITTGPMQINVFLKKTLNRSDLLIFRLMCVQCSLLSSHSSKDRSEKKGVSIQREPPALRLQYHAHCTVVQCSAVQSEQNIAVQLQVRSVLTSFKGNVSVYRSNAPPNAVAGSTQRPMEDPILPQYAWRGAALPCLVQLGTACLGGAYAGVRLRLCQSALAHGIGALSQLT